MEWMVKLWTIGSEWGIEDQLINDGAQNWSLILGGIKMTIDPDFLSVLRCPESGSKLAQATEEQLNAINDKIQDGSLKTRKGDVVEGPMTVALVTVDGQRVFQVMGEIPNLVIEDSIDLTAE